MLKRCFGVGMLLFPILLFSQKKITGTIVDVQDKPVEFLEVLLSTQDSIIVKSELSDSDGHFQIDTNSGNYVLQLKQLGKIVLTKSFLLEEDLDLGMLKVETVQYLNEVVVDSKKKLIERKVDRLVFNVENSVSATGGDAIDALRVTPGIKVQNESISMIGKSGMAVMINDRIVQISGDNLINFLKTIPADNIKQIEVITTPPAKYDAQGNSGIINIKLKNIRKDSWGATIRSVYRQTVYASGGLGADFNFQKDKVTFFSSIDGSNANRLNVDHSRLYYPNELWVNNDPRKVWNKGLSGRTGLDYQVSKSWTIGAQYMTNLSDLRIDEKSNNTNIYDDTTTQVGAIRSRATTYQNPSLHQLNLHTIVKLDTLGKVLSFDVDYFKLDDANDRNYKGNFFEGNVPTTYFDTINNNVQDISNIAAKVDVELPLKWVNLSFGGKVSRSKTNNSIAFYDNETGTPVLDPAQTDQFDYTEDILATYISANKKINDKIETSLGLRIENTETKGVSRTLERTNENDYLKVFPTFYIAYTPNDNNSFNASYSKRINRPNYEQLNPFKMYDSPYSYTEGNPFLQPSFTDNLEFIYTYKNLESKLYYSRTSNGFEQIGILNEETKVANYFVQNFLTSDYFGVTESYTFNPLKWWTSTNAFDANYISSTSDSSVTVNSLEGSNFSFSTTNDFVCNSNKTLFFGLGYWINFPGTYGISEYSTEQSFNASFKCLLLDKSLQISVAGYDIFKTQRPTYTSFSNGVKTEYRNYYDQQSLRIAVSYKFGNKKLNANSREVGNQDEKNRTGK